MQAGRQEQKDRRAASASRTNWMAHSAILGICAIGMAAASPALAKPKKVKPAPVYKAAPVAAAPAPAPVPACSQASAAALDKVYKLKGWTINFPSFGDSLTKDTGCWRTNLAKAGFGLAIYNASIGATNLLSHPSTPYGTAQAYWGQRPSVLSITKAFLTYDLGQYGIPDGQLVFGGAAGNSTNIGYLPNVLQIDRLAYYQTLFDKKLEINFGIIGLGTDFLGSQVGANLANPFGPTGSITIINGLSSSPAQSPAFKTKWNITDRFYNQLAIARSLPAAANPVLADHYTNPSDFRFNGSNVVFGNRLSQASFLVIDEFGYRNAAAPNDPMTWIRAGGFYNNTKEYNLKTQGPLLNPWSRGTTTTSAFYLMGDRQILQVAPSSPYTAYRGLYIGASGQYAPQETSIVTQYYEARLYTLGFFDARPFDQISLVYSHNVLSRYFADNLNNLPLGPGVTLCGLQITCARHATNTVSAAYTAKLASGIYSTVGLQYTDHPSFTYAPYPRSGWVKDSMSFLASLFVNF
jgi:porin